MKIRSIVVLLVIVLASANVSCSRSTYEIADLGTLGGKSSHAEAINEAGQVIGTSSVPGPRGYSRPFFWGPVNGMTHLGKLGAKLISAMNDAGQAVGTVRTADGKQHAFLWDKERGMVDLGTLGGDNSEAYDISNAGQVVGRSETASGDNHVFLWDNANGMTDLGKPGTGEIWHMYINDSGQVIIAAETSEFVQWKDGLDHTPMHVRHIFLWESTNGMRDLGTPGDIVIIEGFNDAGQAVGWSKSTASGDRKSRAWLWDSTNGFKELRTFGGDSSEAFAINDVGQVIGRASKKGLFSSKQGCFWDTNGRITSLGKVGGIGTQLIGESRPSAINDAGQVVGFSGIYELRDSSHAWLWDRKYGIVKLEDLLVDKSGWKQLISAKDINNRGQIVGLGETSGGEHHAFLMTPLPKPAGN